MAFKGFRKKAESESLTIDDLITLERYPEARDRLAKLLDKRPNDLHSHLRLADVYLKLKNLDGAREQYLHVCQAYGREGFYDRAVAVLAKVGRFFPDDHKITGLLAQLERAQRLEIMREEARSCYLRTRHSTESSTHAIDFVKLWENISRSSFADRFSGEEVVWWFEASTTLRIARGKTLVKCGDSDPRIFLLAVGALDATPANKPTSTLRSFRIGDVVGEWALFEGKAWEADYLSPSGATVLTLTSESLQVPLAGAPISKSFQDRLAGQHHDLEIARAVRHVRT